MFREAINQEVIVMKKRRILATIMSAAMFATTLVGCGSDNNNSSSNSGSNGSSGSANDGGGSGSVEELTWMFWDDLNATEDLISLGYKDTIERFNNDFKGKYHVTAITTNLEEYYNKLNALVAAGETPDVFIVSPGPQLTDYVEPGVAAPLDVRCVVDTYDDLKTAGRIHLQVMQYLHSRHMTARYMLFRLTQQLLAVSTIQRCSRRQEQRFLLTGTK